MRDRGTDDKDGRGTTQKRGTKKGLEIEHFEESLLWSYEPLTFKEAILTSMMKAIKVIMKTMR